MKRVLMVMLLIVICATSARAQNVSPLLMFDREVIEAEYTQNNKHYASLRTSIERVTTKPPIQYELKARGAGRYGNRKDVQWEKRALVEERAGQLFTLESSTKIFNRNGYLLKEYRNYFDEQEGTITNQELNNTGNVVNEYFYPIKGPSCDEVTMPFFLKVYARNKENVDYRQFYLITNEPRLYDVNIRDRGVETLSLPAGTFKAIKLQLIADLGPLTEIVAQIIPRTYIWFAEDHPHEWLKYQGMDTGYGTPYVTAVMTSRKVADL